VGRDRDEADVTVGVAAALVILTDAQEAGKLALGTYERREGGRERFEVDLLVGVAPASFPRYSLPLSLPPSLPPSLHLPTRVGLGRDGRKASDGGQILVQGFDHFLVPEGGREGGRKGGREGGREGM